MNETRRRRVAVSWSSGKDSAWTLQVLLRDERFEVASLLTTISEPSNRVTIHGVPTDLVRAQASSARLPLLEVGVPAPCDDGRYRGIMEGAVAEMKTRGIEGVAFGDLFLEDVRARREARMREAGLEALFPLWGRRTDELASEMIGAGLSARIVSVDLRALDATWCGRSFDPGFLADLPAGVDPCGENGEFHTFALSGPMLGRRIDVEAGEVHATEGFAHLEIRHATGRARSGSSA